MTVKDEPSRRNTLSTYNYIGLIVAIDEERSIRSIHQVIEFLMRVYGVGGKFQALARRHLNNRGEIESSDEDSFTTSDEEHSYCLEHDRTYETSPVAPREESIVFKVALTGCAKDSCDDDPFAVLEDLDVAASPKPKGGKAKRRKLTRISKPLFDEHEEKCANDDGKHEFQATIDNISSMISSLKDSEEVITSYSDATVLPTSKDLNMSVVRYGRTRTLLKKQEQVDTDKEYDGSEAENQNEHDHDLSTEAIDTDKEQGLSETHDSSVIHINQLKTLGEGLKFENDLDFLHSKCSSEETFSSELVSCCLLLISNEELRAYVQKYRIDDLWNWMLQFTNPGNEAMCYLQLWVALTVPINLASSHWNKLSPLMTEPSSQIRIPALLYGSKICKLNYKDFSERALVSPRDVVIELWQKYVQPTREGFEKLIETLHTSSPKPIKLVEQHLDRFLTDDVVKALYQSLDITSAVSFNEIDTVKLLVKLTNHHSFLDMLSKPEKSKILQQCLTHITTVNTSAELDNELDLLIVQLGLCLNVVSNEQLKPDELLSSKIHDIIENRKRDTFFDQMLALVFVLYAQDSRSGCRSSTKLLIKKRLVGLSETMKDINETIFDSVQTALQLLDHI